MLGDSAEVAAVPGPRRSRAWLALGAGGIVAAAIVAIVALTRGDGEPQTAKQAPTSAPAFVTIEIAGPPEGTEVFGPAGPLGRAPGRIQLPHGDAGVQLSLRADGYTMAVAHVIPTTDRRIEISLDKKAEPSPEATPTSTVTKPAKPEPKPVAKPEPKPVAKPTKPVTKPVKPETKPTLEPDPYGRK
jgi:hypothetical protein